MSNKTEVKPEEPMTTPGAATSVEHIAPEDHYASGGQHEEQKKELKKSAQKGENEGDANQSPGQHRTGSYTGTSGGQGSGS
ncbi:MAG: hypothetical protein WBQ79_03200 [Acidobacteriaceae bacterium]